MCPSNTYIIVLTRRKILAGFFCVSLSASICFCQTWLGFVEVEVTAFFSTHSTSSLHTTAKIVKVEAVQAVWIMHGSRNNTCRGPFYVTFLCSPHLSF